MFNQPNRLQSPKVVERMKLNKVLFVPVPFLEQTGAETLQFWYFSGKCAQKMFIDNILISASRP